MRELTVEELSAVGGSNVWLKEILMGVGIQGLWSAGTAIWATRNSPGYEPDPTTSGSSYYAP